MSACVTVAENYKTGQQKKRLTREDLLLMKGIITAMIFVLKLKWGWVWSSSHKQCNATSRKPCKTNKTMKEHISFALHMKRQKALKYGTWNNLPAQHLKAQQNRLQCFASCFDSSLLFLKSEKWRVTGKYGEVRTSKCETRSSTVKAVLCCGCDVPLPKGYTSRCSVKCQLDWRHQRSDMSVCVGKAPHGTCKPRGVHQVHTADRYTKAQLPCSIAQCSAP